MPFAAGLKFNALQRWRLAVLGAAHTELRVKLIGTEIMTSGVEGVFA